MLNNFTLKIFSSALTLFLCLGQQALFGQEKNDPEPAGTPAQTDKLENIQKQLKKLADSLQDKMGTLQGQLGDSFEAVKKGFDDVNKRLDGVKIDFGAVQADMHVIKKGLTKVQNDVEKLQDEKMQQELKLQSFQEKLKTLEISLSIMQAEISGLKVKMPDIKLYPPIDKGEWSDLKTKMDQMEKNLLQLKGGNPSVSKSSPNGTCKVVLVNNTAEEILFILNKESVRVAPFSTYNVEAQPVGVLPYEVISPKFGLLKSYAHTLYPNEVFIIRVG